MKKILLLFVSSLLLYSCSKDVENESLVNNVSFFNINTGNKWVYKRYVQNVNTGIVSPTNTIDSVFVVGDTIINSVNYKKIIHKTYDDIINNPSSFSLSKGTRRIDVNGHLVTSTGVVVHPGIDNRYQYTKDFFGQTSSSGNNNADFWGSATFQVQTPESLIVGGQNYYLYNYKGYFTGNQDLSIPNSTINTMYEEQTGLVLYRCPSLSGTIYFEDRLIYYELN